jgi:hypothetical protein
MPVTASEVLFFSGGVIIGAAAGAALVVGYPAAKEKFGPLLAGAEGVIGTTYTDMARKMAERVEAIYDSMEELRRQAQANGATAAEPQVAEPQAAATPG